MEMDDEVCLCFHVKKRKIVNFMRITRPRRASQLSECGGAGTGCGWCVRMLTKYFASYQTGENDFSDDLSSQDYAQERGKYLVDEGRVPPAGATPPPVADENGVD